MDQSALTIAPEALVQTWPACNGKKLNSIAETHVNASAAAATPSEEK